jgi:tetratricopeptide (TPR) repeat protein
MGKLSAAFCDRGKFEDAVELGSRTVEICERVLPGSHAYSTQAQRYLGVALLGLNRFDEAEPLLRRSLENSAERSDSWQTASTQGNLGRLLLLRKRYEEAETHLLAAHEGMKRHEATTPPVDRTEIGATSRMLVQLYREWDRPAEAEKWEAILAAAVSGAQ